MLVTHKTYTTEGAGVLFEDEEDNYQFINTLDRMRVRYDDVGNPCGTNCTYYAYCLMGNHFHLLICERRLSSMVP